MQVRHVHEARQGKQFFGSPNLRTIGGGRARLLRFHEKHPGALGRQLLLRMEEEVRDEEDIAQRENSGRMPVVGKSYLKVLTRVHPVIGKRNQQELATLVTALDHLAGGRAAKAADVLA